MNVLMVSMLFPPAFGGAPVQSLRLAKELIKNGVYVEFVSDNGAERGKTETYESVKVTRLHTYSNGLHSKLREIIFSLKLLFFVILNPRFQIIHFHSIRGLEALLFPIFKLLGKKVILKLTLVDSDDPMTFRRRKLMAPLYMWGLYAADAMCAISEELKQRALEAGIKNEVVKKIYNGFDEANFYIPSIEEKLNLRSKLNLSPDSPIFLSIGKVEHRKGYDLLIESFHDIQLKIPNAHLVIVGPGNDDSNLFYTQLTKLITAKKIRNVYFAGLTYNVHEYVKSADYFLFCSRQEGFGTVLIEAMACGLPTVAMNIQGITDEIITDGRIGKINYSRTPKEFAQQFHALILMTDKNEIEQAVQALKLKFSIVHIAKNYKRLYQSLMAA